MSEDDWTHLKCSRCKSTIITMPGTIDINGQIDTRLALDLMRQCIHHGFVCPQRVPHPSEVK